MKKTNLWLAVFCNAVFLLYGLHYFLPLHNFILSLLINLLIFIVPGIGWIGILKEKVKDSAMILFLIVFFSLGILVTALVGHHILRLKPLSFTFLIYLCVITNTGIFLSRNSKTLKFFIGKKKEFLIFILCSFLVYGCVYYGATTFPPLIDFDVEIPGTTYGLLHELKPYQNSDMSPVYFYFAHPPLANLYSAYGILFLDKVKKFKYYYDSAKAAEKILASSPGDEFFISLPDEKDTYMNVRVFNTDNTGFILTKKDTTGKEEFRTLSREKICPFLSAQDRRLFSQKGLLSEGRTGNLFVSVLMFWSLFKLILYLTKSQLLGIVTGLLYVFSPGIFIRSCSIAPLAITNYGFLMLAYHYILFDNSRISTLKNNLFMFLPGMFAALANQKTLILIAAIILLNIIRCICSKKKRHDSINSIINTSIIGYMVGMALFWTYGFLIDKQSFILYHIRVHFLDRIFHHHQMFFNYPSIWVLWKDFQIEFPIFILAIFALIFLWKKYILKKEGILIFWFLIGAISFSIVDWKQTKHLMCLVPALVALFMMAVARQKKWRKGGFVLLLMVALLYCLCFNVQLLNDFTFYRPVANW